VGDGVAAIGNGVGVGLSVGCACTLGLACGTGGVGFGGGGAIDCRATGAVTGAGLSSSAVIVRDSSGRAGGSLRTLKITASKAMWIAATEAVALTVREFMRLEGTGARPAGTECEARMLARPRAVDTGSTTKQRHFRNISSEMHSVVTKPISNSISNSCYGVSGSWLVTCTGLLTAVD
jgi:hypothetical protein